MSLVHEAKDKTDSRLTVVGALGGQYVFKPPSDRLPDMPENEHVTMRIVEAFGIGVVPSSLVLLASGELSYITKLIDRSDSGEKIHMLDMFQITEAFDKYKGSLEQAKYVEVPKGVEGHQDQADRLWNVLFMFAFFARKESSSHLLFKLLVQLPDAGDWEQNEKVAESSNWLLREVTLKALITALDFDDPSPAIFIMKPFED